MEIDIRVMCAHCGEDLDARSTNTIFGTVVKVYSCDTCDAKTHDKHEEEKEIEHDRGWKQGYRDGYKDGKDGEQPQC